MKKGIKLVISFFFSFCLTVFYVQPMAYLGIANAGIRLNQRCFALPRNDGTIGIIQYGTWNCLKILVGHVDRVNSVILIHRRGEPLIVSGADDMVVKIWRPITGECLKTLTNHSAPVKLIASLSNGSIVSVSDIETLVWNSETWEPIEILTQYESYIVADNASPLIFFSSGSILSNQGISESEHHDHDHENDIEQISILFDNPLR